MSSKRLKIQFKGEENLEEMDNQSEQPFYLSCDFCRKRKGRCDRKRPSCTRCLNSNNECHYTPIKLNNTNKLKLEQIDLRRRYKYVIEKLSDISEKIITILYGLPDNFKCTGALNTSYEEILLRQLTINSSDEGYGILLKSNCKLKKLLKLYVTCYYPFVPLIYKPTFFKAIYQNHHLFYSVLAIATMYSKEMEKDGFKYAKLASALLSNTIGNPEIFKVMSHLHLNFFFHCRNKLWLGWKHAGLATRFAGLLELNKILEMPTNNLKKDLVERELLIRGWWGSLLVDRCVSLMFDKPLLLHENESNLLIEYSVTSEWCPIHDPNNTFQSKLCKHSKLERYALLENSNFFIIELYLISKMTMIHSLNRSLLETDNNYSNSKKYKLLSIIKDREITYKKKVKHYIEKVTSWRNYLNTKYPLNNFWYKENQRGSKDNIQAYQYMSLHILNNNSIILLHYPNFTTLTESSNPIATAAALLSCKIFLFLVPRIDVFSGPLWYFNIYLAAFALHLAIKYPSNQPNNQNIKLALNRLLATFENVKNPRWPLLHEFYFNKLQLFKGCCKNY
ncbi:hypothetical protein K502DRAFT_325491 [Neoconidiobolus thromboides FSU 785]|nr:hypothetical protein K502DRAFT_325491 [Neoconidiobolus thromboides FSU 785]